jgi:hypothetical protein
MILDRSLQKSRAFLLFRLSKHYQSAAIRPTTSAGWSCLVDPPHPPSASKNLPIVLNMKYLAIAICIMRSFVLVNGMYMQLTRLIELSVQQMFYIVHYWQQLGRAAGTVQGCERGFYVAISVERGGISYLPGLFANTFNNSWTNHSIRQQPHIISVTDQQSTDWIP